MIRLTLATRVLIGLVSGFLLGVALTRFPSTIASGTLSVLTPAGTLFINLIRMTVVPLVVSMLVSSVGGAAASRGLGRSGMRALVISIGLLTLAAVGSIVITDRIVALLPIDRSAALSPQTAPASGATGSGASEAPTLSTWLVDLVPPNVFKAAADGAMLPLIVFSVAFGLALTRIHDARRDAVLRVVDGIAETMQQIVVWILDLAPVGVFALAVPLASRIGWSAPGAVAAYIALVVGLTIASVALLLYPLGILTGPLSPSAFMSYCAPAQAIGFASRSSLAALPAMVESAEHAGLPAQSCRVVLPLAIVVFHFGTAVAQTVGVLFLAHLFGVALTVPQLTSVVFAVVLTSFAVPGIPGGSIIAMVPALTVANVPVDGMAILLAVDTIPDMFRTTANLTGALTLTAILPAAKE